MLVCYRIEAYIGLGIKSFRASIDEFNFLFQYLV
uniref:Uncharacterized protein n=1 Tax=Rhizophora mucronata TaxID=61149 RepID=A0A2P2NEU8_RHIMU